MSHKQQSSGVYRLWNHKTVKKLQVQVPTQTYLKNVKLFNIKLCTAVKLRAEDNFNLKKERKFCLQTQLSLLSCLSTVSLLLLLRLSEGIVQIVAPMHCRVLEMGRYNHYSTTYAIISQSQTCAIQYRRARMAGGGGASLSTTTMSLRWVVVVWVGGWVWVGGTR